MGHCEVLIVEDDKDDIEFLTEAFIASGVTAIHHVNSVDEAYTYLDEVFPDCIPKLIVTDLFLPKVSGEDFLRSMQSLEKYKDVKMVIVSTAKSEQRQKTFCEMGALDYKHKPVSYEEYVVLARELKDKAGL